MTGKRWASKTRPTLRLSLPSTQIHSQRPIHRRIGAQQVIIDLHVPRLLPQRGAERLKILQILRAQSIRIDEQLVARQFQVAELRQPVEREVDLFRGEDVEEQDF